MLRINDLEGHPEIKNCLNGFIREMKLPSTFLFRGPKGVGKNRFALAFASELLQAEGDHPDLRHYFPEGKSYLHTMESIHQFIREVELPPFQSERKVLILSEADCMQRATANALLKTLEEPLHSSIIILTTSHHDEILPTIISRCFPIVFSPLSTESPQRGDLVSKAAYFSIRREYLQFFKVLTEIESLEEGKEGSMLDRSEEILSLLFYWYRDLHLLKIGGDPKYLFYKDKIEDLRACLEYPIPSLEEFQKRIYKVEEAQKYQIRLRASLQALLL